jgi:1,4-alpha-glucan branching enzyme
VTAVATAQLEAIVRREHGDPHSILGGHPDGDGVVIRAYRPAARAVTAQFDDGRDVELEEIHPGGVFEGAVLGAELPLRYRFEVDYGEGGSFTIEDPYRFIPTIGDLDLHLIGQGRHEELYEKLGSHLMEHEGVRGTAFAVWAPSARAVSVVGDFNSWDGRLHAMRSMGSGGIWEIFLPDVAAGARYKFELLTPDRELRLKTDPYAQEVEAPPKTASVVIAPKHEWRDDEWLARRATSKPLERPMSIYEVHPGSWRRNPREPDRPLTFLELADELSAYVADMGFTHVELMPVMAHPFSGSWGYQVTGYFAPAASWGKPDELREFIDRMHENGIGVILDWVPAHFPRDDFALAHFDGTALRARRPTARRPPRLGHADLQLRPPRGAQLPALERAVLAARVPRRRHPGGRGGVDALPRLFARGRRVGPQRVRRPRGSRRGVVPQGDERGAVRPRARHRDGGRGVDRVAGRVTPHLPRRARLRLQVEPGLDARHARLLPARSDLPPLSPPRADVQPDVRL